MEEQYSDEVHFVQQDANGQWWCVDRVAWTTNPEWNVISMEQARKCTVDPGVIALLDLAGEDQWVPDVGALYVPEDWDIEDMVSPVYQLLPEHCPVDTQGETGGNDDRSATA